MSSPPTSSSPPEDSPRFREVNPLRIPSLDLSQATGSAVLPFSPTATSTILSSAPSTGGVLQVPSDVSPAREKFSDAETRLERLEARLHSIKAKKSNRNAKVSTSPAKNEKKNTKKIEEKVEKRSLHVDADSSPKVGIGLSSTRTQQGSSPSFSIKSDDVPITLEDLSSVGVSRSPRVAVVRSSTLDSTSPRDPLSSRSTSGLNSPRISELSFSSIYDPSRPSSVRTPRSDRESSGKSDGLRNFKMRLVAEELAFRSNLDSERLERQKELDRCFNEELHRFSQNLKKEREAWEKDRLEKQVEHEKDLLEWEYREGLLPPDISISSADLTGRPRAASLHAVNSMHKKPLLSPSCGSNLNQLRPYFQAMKTSLAKLRSSNKTLDDVLSDMAMSSTNSPSPSGSSPTHRFSLVDAFQDPSSSIDTAEEVDLNSLDRFGPPPRSVSAFLLGILNDSLRESQTSSPRS